jgi:hypothetical protein
VRQVSALALIRESSSSSSLFRPRVERVRRWGSAGG